MNTSLYIVNCRCGDNHITTNKKESINFYNKHNSIYCYAKYKIKNIKIKEMV
jgi:hypothetical protein